MVEGNGNHAIRRVAVVGAGMIGAGWTACFLAHGLEVCVSDPAPAAADFVARFVAEAWPLLARHGLAPSAAPERWRFQADPAAAVDGADFVQESAPDRYEIKLDLLKRLDRALPREVVIASSSSGLLISRLQEGCNYAERLVIGQPFNPAHIVPLVEVVGGLKTSPRTVEIAMAFYRSVGKHPIRLQREVPGHVANRLQNALWREAVQLLAEGVASVADIDAAMVDGPALRLACAGPHLGFALDGGAGGMAHFLDRLAPPGLAATLGAELRQALVDGVAQEAGGRPIERLARQRDAALLRLIEARHAPDAET